MSAPPGRRERKKQQTRQAVSDVATTLFLQRGFDAVTVAEIAAAADVAVQTVFNHFPAKEDLFFDELRWVTGPADAVCDDPDRPTAATLRDAYLDGLRAQHAVGHLVGFPQFVRTIEASPALRARRAHLAEEMQERLATALAGGDPGWRDRLVAARFAAVRRVLDDELVHRLELRPDDLDAVLAEFVPVADEAFEGLGGR